ncbi:Protein of unknown function [Cotesia congregata]|uniref:Uncharacterized protein n=1 Tax=Cotesia congregata TaxID=51543 RepID=A0A8J2HCE2_COTCN|nr:Protein of unknown function [Cotesia congregata]
MEVEETSPSQPSSSCPTIIASEKSVLLSEQSLSLATNFGSDLSYEPPMPVVKTPKINVLTAELIAVLDRTNWGDFVAGGFCLGEVLSGRFCLGEISSRGDFRGEILSGRFFPGRFCRVTCIMYLKMEKQIYLIGYQITKFVGSKLPSLKEVMFLFFHYHCSQSLTIKKSALITIENVFDLSSEAGIPTCAKNSAVRILIRHHTVGKNLLKNKNQKLSSTQKKKVSIFCADIEKLFDIAHHKVMKLINENQKLFLQGQIDEVFSTLILQ